MVEVLASLILSAEKRSAFDGDGNSPQKNIIPVKLSFCNGRPW